MPIKIIRGPVSYLRVHEVGSKYGPAHDQLDAEVIVKLANHGGAYGFQLRPGNDLAVGEAMLALISDAFNAKDTIVIEYEERAGKSNHPIIRVIREA